MANQNAIVDLKHGGIMKSHRTLRNIFLTVILLGSSPLLAEEQEQIQSRTRDQLQQESQLQTREQSRTYGSQLMTPEEHQQYRNKMRNMKTEEEREAYRQEHHRMMQERAKEKGLTLPENPPERGMKKRAGGGMGPGGGGNRSR
jgi:hypothetical protein